jgi:hypothetical protein
MVTNQMSDKRPIDPETIKRMHNAKVRRRARLDVSPDELHDDMPTVHTRDTLEELHDTRGDPPTR